MRDTNRIHETTEKLSILWKEYFPDWRLGQLINNLSRWSENDLFYLEEDDFIELLIDFIIDIHTVIEIKREDVYVLFKKGEIA